MRATWRVYPVIGLLMENLNFLRNLYFLYPMILKVCKYFQEIMIKKLRSGLIFGESIYILIRDTM